MLVILNINIKYEVIGTYLYKTNDQSNIYRGFEVESICKHYLQKAKPIYQQMTPYLNSE